MNKWLIALAVLLVGGVFLWYRYKVPKYINGEQAADFSAQLADGSTARLSDLRGKYVLLHFWGSWCGPCRKENPELVALYQKHHAQGFDVFSVGIEQNMARWQKAIVSDSLAWRHHTVEIGDFDGSIAKLYRVWQIPSTWLIDPEGRIVGTNLLPSQMDKVLGDKLLR